MSLIIFSLFFLVPFNLQSNEVKDEAKALKVIQHYEKQITKYPKDVDLLFVVGDAYYSLGDYRLAAEYLNRAAELDPSDNKIKLRLALSYLFINQPNKSKALLEELKEEEPDNPQVWFGLGRVAQLEYRYDEADKFYEKALDLDPENLTALSLLGELRYKQERYVEAIEIFEKIKELYPEANWVNKAIQIAKLGPDLNDIEKLELEGNYTQAEKLYENLIEANPNLFILYEKLGKLFVKDDRLEDAVNVYRKGLIRFEEKDKLWVLLGYVFLETENLAQADNAFQQVLSEDPDNVEALTGLARIEMKKKNYKKADEYFKQALELQPYNQSTLTYYAEFLLDQKLFKKSELLFEELKSLDPSAKWIQEKLDALKFSKILDEIDKNIEAKEYSKAVKLYKKLIEKSPGNTEFYLGLGQVYIDSKKYSDAIKIYQERLKKNPQSYSILNALGFVFLKQGKIDESSDIFRKVSRLNPDNPETLVGLGRVAEVREDLKESEYYYQKAINLDSKNVLALSTMAQFKMKQKDYKEAERLYLKILSLKPDAKWALAGLQEAEDGPALDDIKGFVKEGNYYEAVYLYRDLLEKSPKNEIYYLKLGKLYIDMNRSQNAVKIFLKGLNQIPDSTDLKIALGYAYLKQRFLNKSRTLFEDVLAKESENSEAWAGLGRVEEILGKTKEAETFYQTALTYNPEDISALTYLGDLYVKQKRFDEAEEVYLKLRILLPDEDWVRNSVQDIRYAPILEKIEKIEGNEAYRSQSEELRQQLLVENLYYQLIAKAPENPRYYLGLGKLYASMKRFPQAIRIYKRGLVKSPDAVVLQVAMGYAYLFQEDYEKATKEFQISLEKQPNNSEAWAGLGKIAEKRGDLVEAESLYQNALSLNPYDETALSYLANLKIEQGRYEQAKALYEELKRLKPQSEWVDKALGTIDLQPLLKQIQNLQADEKYEQAASLYSQILSQVQENPDFYLSLGNLFIKMKKYGKAIDVFKQGLQVNSESPELLAALGIAYINKKDLSSARSVLDKAYALTPDDAEVLAGLGRITALEGEMNQAEGFYNQALVYGPDNISALSFYGELLMDQKRYQEAQDLYARLIQLDPKASWARRAWNNAKEGPLLDGARSLYGLGLEEAAEEKYLDLLTLSPDNADYYFLLGQLYVEREDFDQAIDIFLYGLEVDPEATYLWRVIAFTYLSKECICQAHSLFLWLLDEDPDDAESWVGLGKVMELCGDPCTAEDYYAHAMSLSQCGSTAYTLALTYLADLKVDSEYYFEARSHYFNLMQFNPEARWIRDRYKEIKQLTRPFWLVEGKYYEENEWNDFVDEWIAKYRVYGVRSELVTPINNCFTFEEEVANEFYELEQTLDDFRYYSFDVTRLYFGGRWVLSPCYLSRAKLGVSYYRQFRDSTFKEKEGVFVEPEFYLTYHNPKTLLEVGIDSDCDLVARDFTTNRAKMVGRYYLIGRYEREFCTNWVFGTIAGAYYYDDYVDNTSQGTLSWVDWSPTIFNDILTFRYQFQWGRFRDTIPDYFTYKYRLVHHIQFSLDYTWCDSFYTNIGYAHGWENRRTRFAQIIVTPPFVIPQPFFNDRRQYNYGFLNIEYDECQFYFGLDADFYRDSEKYTIWSSRFRVGYHF